MHCGTATCYTKAVARQQQVVGTATSRVDYT
jgi:hypothetical protein